MTADLSAHAIGPRPEDSEEALLWAGKQLFAQKGFDGATVKELADLAQVNVSMVSYYFGGKEGLFKALIERFGLSRLEATERLLKPAATLEEFRVKLTLFTEDVLFHHLANSELTAIIHQECRHGHPVAEESFRKVFLKIIEAFISFVESARTGGLLRSEINPLVSCGLYFGSLIHLINSAPMAEKFFGVSLRDPEQREAVIQTAVTNFLEGVVSRS